MAHLPSRACAPGLLAVAVVALLAGCRVDAPDLGGFAFACEVGQPDACPGGQTCVAGTCQLDAPIDGGPDDPDGPPGVPDAAADPSLLVHLPLDGVASGQTEDVAGDHDATCEAGACPGAAAGAIDGALEFDGTDDGLTVGDTTALGPTSGTLAGWVYLTGSPAAVPMTVIGKPFGAAGVNAVVLWLYDDYPHASSNTLELAGSAKVPPTTWTHVATTWTATTLRLFVAGVEVDSGSGTPAFDANPFLIGVDRNDGDLSSFLTGRLDDLRIYDRALSAAEIAQLAAAGR